MIRKLIPVASGNKDNKDRNKKIATITTVIVILLTAYTIFFTNTDFPFGKDPLISEVFRESILSDKAGVDTGKETDITEEGAVVQELSSGQIPAAANVMQVHVIDVGQGSSTLFISNGRTILIDAGENGKGQTVINYLHKLGVSSIDLFIGTHPHSDHIGGMDEVLREYKNTQTIIMPTLPKGLVPTTQTYLDVLETIEQQGNVITPAVVGDIYDIGNMHLEILGPGIAYKDLNNMSVVSHITFGRHSVMVTGDAESEAEATVLFGKKADIFHSDIYIVGHHGSSTSSSQKFLDALNPSFAAMSLGANNSYGHPHKETVEKLNNMKIPYYRTDINGNIVFNVSDYGIDVELSK
jgi:competence protein ComEC